MFAAFALAASGYEWGTADHGIHAAFVDMVFHKNRWTGDLLAQAAPHHPSFYFHLHALFATVLGQPLAAALLHLGALLGLGFGLHRLAATLWDGDHVPPLALLLAAPAHFALGGVMTLDPLALPRGLALALLAIATWLLFAGRAVGAFLVLGIAACLHMPSAVPVGVGLVLAHRVFRRRGSGGPATAPLAALIGAAPIFWLWVRGGGAGLLLKKMDDDWWRIVSARLAHHIDPTTWPLSEFAMQGAWLIVGVVALRGLAPRPPLRKAALAFVLGVCLWIALGAGLLGPVARLAIAWQLEPWESCRILTLLCVLAAGAWLSEIRAVEPAGEAARVLLILLLLVGAVLPALPLLGLVAARERRCILTLPLAARLAFGVYLVILTVLSLFGGMLPERFGLMGVADAGTTLGVGWFLDGGLGAVVSAAVAVLVLRVWTDGRRDEGPERWLSSTRRSRVLVGLFIVILVAGQDPSDGRAPTRFLPLGLAQEEVEFVRVLPGLVPEGSVTVVPPAHFEVARAYAVRPLFVTWKDGGEALFSREVAMEWERRVRVACACDPLATPLPSGGEPGVRLGLLRARMDDGNHKAWAGKLAGGAQAEGASFLVLRSFDPTSRLAGRPIRFRNAAFHLYGLDQAR